ncbi:MAG: type II toxin-antitoxin system HigB family toxin [Microcystis aeruginosa L211-11]|nr:type II toxin-antitoxin system HigB family toxin [Microcystis aeruginosa L211-11]
MHVISYRRLREFTNKHADSRIALENWYKIASKAIWYNLVEVQTVFPKAEAVGNFTVFNIKGNSYRLIKYVLTHAEYDKEQWKNDPYF